MAQQLEEFLVSLKFGVDAASQQSFLRSLEQVVGRVSKLGAAMAGLGASIVELARRLAQSGDHLYWMGQRLGSSVGDIEATSAALSQLGASGEEAHRSLEALGSFGRQYGSAATGFLRSLGVTATDTAGQLKQLAPFFEGKFAQGPNGYAIALQYAQMLGISENVMRSLGSGEFSREEARKEGTQREIFGPGAKGQIDAVAESGKRLTNIFKDFGFYFQTLAEWFASKGGGNFLPRMEAELTKLYQLMQAHLPDIQKFLKGFADTLITVFKVLEGIVGLVASAVKWWDELGESSKRLVEIIALVTAGIAVLSSPILLVLGALAALLLLIDDYEGWKKGDRESQFNWGPFVKFMEEWGKFFSDLMDGHLLAAIGAIGGAILTAFAVSKLSPFIGGLTKMLEIMGGMAKLFLRGGPLGWLAALGVIAGGYLFEQQHGENVRQQDEVRSAAEAAGLKWDPERNVYVDAQGNTRTEAQVREGLGYQYIPDLESGGGRWVKPGETTGFGGTGGGPAGTVTPGGTKTGVGLRDRIMDLLKVSPKVASAIAANLLFESKGNPNQPGIGPAAGHMGLAQWDQTRWGNLLTWAKKNELNPYDADTQIRFIGEEIRTDQRYRGLYQQMEGSNDPTRDFRESFERPEAASRGAATPLYDPIMRAPLPSAPAVPASPTLLPPLQTSGATVEQNVQIAFYGQTDPHTAASAVGGTMQRQNERLVREFDRRIV
jgi:hypothetical protein